MADKPDSTSPPQMDRPALPTRRSILKGVGVAAVTAGAILDRTAPAARAAEPSTLRKSSDLSAPVKGSITLALNINEQERSVTVEPRTTLLSALRDRLEPPITGPKLICDAGTCGGCTVLLDGKAVYGCSVLAIDALGKKITTVEGLGTPEHLTSVQNAFVDKDAMMCGFCTPGFVTSLTALLRRNPNPTEQQVRAACQGNFCRCGTYPHVFQAALAAAKNGVPPAAK